MLRCDPREADECARLGLLVARAINDPGTVDCLRIRAEACVFRGRFRPAMQFLETAIAEASARGDELLTARLEIPRLQSLVHLERYIEARDTGHRILAIFEQHEERKGQLLTHMALADLAFRMDRPREALRHYARVDVLLGDFHAPRFRAALASNRANSLEACNRFNAAERHFDLARELFAAEGCEHSAAQVDYNAAYGEALRGRYTDALRRYASTARAFTRLEDERHLAHIDLDRAEIHVHLNLTDDAFALASRAEERFEKLDLAKECGQAALLCGRAAAMRGDLDEAERCYERAEKRFLELGLGERRFACVVQRGSIAARAGRRDEARRLADEAADLLGGGMNPLSKASVELLHARLDLAEGDSAKALYRAETVRMDCLHIHAPWIQIDVHWTIGRAFVQRKQLDQAILAYKNAIDHLESYRGGVPPDEYMTAFLAGRSELYTEIVDLLARAGHTELAFEFTERAKSRALADLLAGRPDKPRAGADSSSAVHRLRHLREQLNAVYGRLFVHAGDGETRNARAIGVAREKASRLEEEIRRLLREESLKDREAASLQATDAPDLESVRRDLEPDTALLEYLVTKDALLTFVVTRETTHVVRQEMAAEELRHRVRRFRFHLAKFDRPQPEGMAEQLLGATRANLAELTNRLLEPVMEQLDVKRLVILPHGVLHHVPFHALPLGDAWVADRFEVVYAPSAAVYGFCKKPRRFADGPPCIFGLPDAAAPQIEREAHEVAQVLGTDRVFLREDATSARLQSEAHRARILHVATHGMFRREQPMLSGIRLADTWLNLYDLYELDLNAELVVLSTCESGTADVTDGDEILGLTRGFLYAGAPALLASQWRVNDATTTDLMSGFYRHLETCGEPAAALKDAMAEIRARLPHPYHWAPFFLTGRPVQARHPTLPKTVRARDSIQALATTQLATQGKEK